MKILIKEIMLISNYKTTRHSYKRILKKLRKKLYIEGGVIRVGFYVVYSASWSLRPLFEKMLKDKFFDVRIVVCPDVFRGEKNQNEVLYRVYNELCSVYGMKYVINSYDKNRGFVDLSDNFDIIGIANPYDEMTHKFYGTEYLSTMKKKLVFYNVYGYSGLVSYDVKLLKCKSYNTFWKLFVDNEYYKQLAKKYQYIHGENMVISGLCKMDKLAFCQNKNYDGRKSIIIAPHHTVRKTENGLNLSNFLRFSELIQELPKRYKNIDFIFRPHPLLFVTLRCDDLWGNNKVDEYLARLLENENIVYSAEGEYLDIFNSSDAIINDCCSFLAEYFYTGKPQCYVLQDENQFNKEFTYFGKKLFNYVYKAFTKEDIYEFIETVVIKDNDIKKSKRIEFAEKEIMINYPNVSDFIINNLKEALCE